MRAFCRGVISGPPTAAAAFTFTGKVTDSSTPGQNIQQSFSLTVNPAGCTPQNFVSGSTTPTSVNPGAVYQVSCDYGVIYDHIFGNNCDGFSGTFQGTAAVFNCTAPATPGSYAQSCQLGTSPPQNFCPRNFDPAGTLTVNTSQLPPTIISILPSSGTGYTPPLPDGFTVTIANPNGAADVST